MRLVMILAFTGASLTLQADQPASLANQRLNAVMRAPLCVAVFASPDIKASLVSRVLDETEAIWETGGITFHWDRAPSTDGEHARCLSVTIDDEPTDVSASPGALGWILFTSSGPASSIHLSRVNAEALLRDTNRIDDRTSYGHETLLARALGRALSHELGHYLLKSKVHTPHGLMRAMWPSDELFSNDRRGFELTVDQHAVVEHAPTVPVG